MKEWIANLEINEEDPDSPVWKDGFAARLLEGLAGYKPVFITYPSEPNVATILLSVEADDSTQADALAEYLVNQVFDRLGITRPKMHQSESSTLAELLEALDVNHAFKVITNQLRHEGLDLQFPTN